MKLDPDAIAWMEAPYEHKWLFSKLMLAEFLGYKCGPAGVPVPETGKYVVRPIINIGGMSAGAEILELTPESSLQIPPGYFWCEKFEGRHISLDLEKGVIAYAVEGFKRADDIRFDSWQCVGYSTPSKDEIRIMKLLWMYDNVNIESIGGKVIEVHLRGNPNPICKEYSMLKVIWEDDKVGQDYIKLNEESGWTWIPAEDDSLGNLEYKRLGFLAI